MNISSQEIKKLAKLSQIEIVEEELARLQSNLQDVLNYAERVCEIARDVPEQVTFQANVMREDVACAGEAPLIMQQAPERAENFFVVPKIL